LTFVVIGGGPTGVEMAGAVNELAKQTLRRDFRQIDPAYARIILIDGVDRVLPTFPNDLSAKAAESLQRIGVEIWTKSTVIAVQSGQVTVQRQDSPFSNEVHIDAATVIWSAGVQASPLGKVLADATGAESDRAGRIAVHPDLTIAGHPEVFVIGDLAVCKGEDGKPLPGVAPVAIQQGEYVAKLIERRIRGETVQPFRLRDRGRMATIGRASAVAIIFGRHLSGFVAWLAWLFIHLMYLVAFENRLLVLMQWGWSYFTRSRSSRLITGDANPLDEPPDSHDNQQGQSHPPR
jgi:NADH dehydrogenase